MTVRRIITVLLSLFIIICAAVPAFASGLPEKGSTAYVNDAANILSQDTELRLDAIGAELAETCGCDLVVLTQRNVDGSMKEFSNAVFDAWDISVKGVLVVLNTQGDTYYAVMGTTLQRNFTQSDINDLLLEYMEPYFAEKNYDAGVLAFADAVKSELTKLYYVEPVAEEEPEDKSESGFVSFLKGFVKFVLILAVMVAAVVAFVYARGQYLRLRRIREQRQEEILSGSAPSSYVPRREEPHEEAAPAEADEPAPFPTYNFDEEFKVDMDRDYSSSADPETQEFDLYKTYSSTKYDFETFSKRK